MKDKILIGTIVVLSGLLVVSNYSRMKNLISIEKTEEEVPLAYELTEIEQSILYYEELEANGELTQEDYYTLAQLYLDDNLKKDARDLLEQSYRLNQDEESLTMLEDIVVNSDEETTEVNDVLRQSILDCKAEGFDLTTTAALLSDEEFAVLMPKLQIGTRSYYYSENGNIYYLTLSYQEDGSRYLKTAIYNADDSYSQIVRSGDEVQLFTCDNYKYRFSGQFNLKTANVNGENVTNISGTLEKNVITGQLIIDSDEEYVGNFENGLTTLEQPEEEIIENLISGSDEYTSAVVYAVDESNEQALWAGLTSDDEVITFGIEQLNIEEVEQVSEYTPGTEPKSIVSEVSASNYRIYDGVLQCFDGTYWVDIDTIEKLAVNDPFTNITVSEVLADSNESTEGVDGENNSDEDELVAALTLSANLKSGSLVKNTASSKSKSEDTTADETATDTTQETTTASKLTTNTSTTTYVASGSSSNDSYYAIENSSSTNTTASQSTAAATTSTPAVSTPTETTTVVTPSVETPTEVTPAADTSTSSDSTASNETEISYDSDWGFDVP